MPDGPNSDLKTLLCYFAQFKDTTDIIEKLIAHGADLKKEFAAKKNAVTEAKYHNKDDPTTLKNILHSLQVPEDKIQLIIDEPYDNTYDILGATNL